MAGLTIGALAAAAGVRRDTVRYYERFGLMPAPPRTDAGYRSYSEADVDRVRFIRRAAQLGFTLNEIGNLLTLQSSESARAADVLRVTDEKIGELRSKVAELRGIRSVLEQLAAGCPVDAPASDCPILAHFAGAAAQRGKGVDSEGK